MCGIIVVADTAASPRVDEHAAARMRDMLMHRGPDDATLDIVDSWVALGHRRLSIIDVDGARQPLRSEDGRVLCIFNGEIYNFVALRERLTALGHQFATAGDGEVIVHGYEQWGEDIFSKLEGMFAVALVDRNQRRLLLARDRFGIKPLFYRWNGAALTAGSELKALVVDRAAPTASRLALSLGALRMHVPWPLTAFSGVYRLPPGALLEVSPSRAPRLSRFAQMALGPSIPSRGPDEALEQLRIAVRRQMVADVPVGAFLSGGIDSTLIVSIMRSISNAEIHTFSIGTREQDESGIAAQTARELETTHHTIDIEEIGFSDLASLPQLFDEPFAETSALGVRALSRFARSHVKVALSGDGGDEVFGGYDSYRWIRGLSTLPRAGAALIGRAAHRTLVARRWPASLRRALRAALMFGDSPGEAQRDATTLAWAADVLTRSESERLSSAIEAASGINFATVDETRRAMLADRLERLPNAMLAKVDVASMTASLEVRVPMLDDALVRYADQLPVRELVGLRYGKLLLRRLLARMPGGRVAWKEKSGFTLPLDRWMSRATIASPLNELFGDHRATLLTLTQTDAWQSWRSFQDRTSRFSQGTAAMQLLWFATVALWADRFDVRTVDTHLETAPVV